MMNQKSTGNFALFLCPLARAEYSGCDCYHRKLAKMMSSSSFSTHAECARHQACAVSSAYFAFFIFSSFSLPAQIEPSRRVGASYHTLTA